MKEKGLLFSILPVLMLSLVSAELSLSEMFDNFDESTIVYGCLFLIFFGFIYFASSKIFSKRGDFGKREPNTGIATVISLAMSLLITYGLYKADFNFVDIIGGVGISTNALYLFFFFAFLAGAIWLGVKTKWNILLVLGIFFIVLSLFNVFYENTLVLVIGVILLFIYFGLKIFVKKK